MNKIFVGYTTMTHGLKGELKFYTDVSFKDRFLKKDFPIFIHFYPHKITSVRPHKNHYLITIDSLFDINLVENFRNKDVYILESDLQLLENEVVLELLVDFFVYEKEECLGKVNNILYNKGGVLLEIQGKSKFLLPYQPYFIDEIFKKEKKIMVQNVKGYLI